MSIERSEPTWQHYKPSQPLHSVFLWSSGICSNPDIRVCLCFKLSSYTENVCNLHFLNETSSSRKPCMSLLPSRALPEICMTPIQKSPKWDLEPGRSLKSQAYFFFSAACYSYFSIPLSYTSCGTIQFNSTMYSRVLYQSFLFMASGYWKLSLHHLLEKRGQFF